MSAAAWFQVLGFVLACLGLALWSLAIALVVGGVVLFVCGGLAARQ